ncbi:MAG: hypothetical protein KDB23_11385, partial [Planctomycetales bacterium]|nr:hypothetical protein [Planctomycetales bacterium]
EQVWDSDDLPERQLRRGRPAGSAMPLVWAHAEYIKLLRSLRDGQVFDLPPQAAHRYARNDTTTQLHSWRFNHKCRVITQGKTLRIETLVPAMIHWTTDQWQTVNDTGTVNSMFGVYYADLPTASLVADQQIEFTFFWPASDHWEGQNYEVQVID